MTYRDLGVVTLSAIIAILIIAFVVGLVVTYVDKFRELWFKRQVMKIELEKLREVE